jgi:hypothetical protein
MKSIESIYIASVALLVVFLVGIGIWAFYPDPHTGAVYYRNVLIVAYIWGLLFITVSFALKPKMDVIASGLMLGGLFTIFYGLIMGIVSGSRVLMFTAVAIGLIVLIALGYFRLVPRRRHNKSEKDDVQD